MSEGGRILLVRSSILNFLKKERETMFRSKSIASIAMISTVVIILLAAGSAYSQKEAQEMTDVKTEFLCELIADLEKHH